MSTQAAVFSQLENVLADLYRDEESAARVATAAGMDVSRIAFKDRAIDNWHEIVREAEHQSKLPALLRVVTAEYPVYPPLQTAATAYDQWMAAGRPAPPPETAAPLAAPASRMVTPSPPAARSSRRWVTWLAVIVSLLVVAIGIYLLWPKTVTERTVTVPDLRGELSERARLILREAGLEVDLDSASDSTVSPGHVIKTIPPAGSQVAPRSSVTLVIASAAAVAAATVPYVAGLDPGEAQYLVEQAGLSALMDKEYSPDIPAGRISRVEPPTGSQVAPGARITLFESLGPAPGGAVTHGEIVLVTGENGTVDNVQVEFAGAFPGSPYRVTLDQPNDLGPWQKDAYSFAVPAEFCAMTDFAVRKLDGPGGDDDWYLKEIYLMLDGVDVYFDAVADRLMTASSFPYGGGWSGTEAYRNRCGG